MNITTETASPAEPLLPGQGRLPNILVQGFSLARRNWSFVLWAYAVNLVFGLLAGLPFSGLASFLDHSLAAQRLAGTLDLETAAELFLHTRQSHFLPMATHSAVWLNLLQLLMLFLLFAGAVFVYVSGEPPKVSVLLRGGVAYFWRFVRAALIVWCAAGLILGILLALRATLLARLAEFHSGRTIFIWAAATGAVVFLIGLILRLWFDLVEVYVVRNAMGGELRAHRSLLPALRLLLRHFFRLFGSFLLTGTAGVIALGVCLLLWKSLPANQVWMAALLAQTGLFLLLASRFWQRGTEVALVLAVDPPMTKVVETVVIEEQTPSLAGVAGLPGMTDPTLRELVQKLQTEPWAAPPDAAPRLTPAVSPPAKDAEAAPVPVLPEKPAPTVEKEPGTSPADLHATKYPLGGAKPAKEPTPADPSDSAEPARESDPPPRPGKPLR